MKKSLSLMAVLAATATALAAPASAQNIDMSAFLSPNALVADLGIEAPRPSLVMPRAAAPAPSTAIILAEPVAPTALAAPAADLGDIAELMDEMADAAPYGANSAVILQAPVPRPSWFQRLFGL